MAYVSTFERWFCPNYWPGTFIHTYSSAAWGAYFVTSTVLDSVLPNVDIFGLFGWPVVTGVSENLYAANLLGILKAHNVGASWATGYISDTGNGGGQVYATTITNPSIDRFFQTGGYLPANIVIDGFPLYMFQNGYSQDQANFQLLVFLQTVHAAYPGLEIGLDVNFASWPFTGAVTGYVPSYTNNVFNPYCPDYSVVLQSMMNFIRANGEDLAFLQCDMPYDQCVGLDTTGSWPGQASAPWMQRTVDLGTLATGLGMKYGIMVNSIRGGTTPSNSTYYIDTMEHVAGWATKAGFYPDQVISNCEFSAAPSDMLPTSTLYTGSRLQLSMTGFYQKRIPVTISHTLVINDEFNCAVVMQATIANLKTTANGGLVQSSSGYDIYFYGDANLSQRLDWEIETWNGTTGAITVWINIPHLSPTNDTTIYIAVGRPNIDYQTGNWIQNVWEDYGNVPQIYHFGVGSLVLNDSGPLGLTLTNSGATAATGFINGGATASGTNKLTVNRTVTCNDFTLSLWVKDASDTVFHIGAYGATGYIEIDTGNYLASGGTPHKATLRIKDDLSNTATLSGTVTIDDGAWHNIVVTRVGTQIAVITDWSLESTATFNANNISITLLQLMGDTAAPAQTIDEVRFWPSSGIDQQHVRADVLNQASPATYVTVGTATATVPNVPGIGTPTPNATGALVPYTAPADGGSAIVQYLITSTPGPVRTMVPGPGSGVAVVSGLLPATSYTFTVHASNAIGNSVESVSSTSITTFDVPTAPTIGNAVARPFGADVNFLPPSSDGGSPITSYTAVSFPGGFIGTVAAGIAQTIPVNGLQNGISYTFTVYATNGVGNGPVSASSNAVVPGTAVPSPPTIYKGSPADTKAYLWFTTPESDGGLPITSYTAKVIVVNTTPNEPGLILGVSPHTGADPASPTVTIFQATGGIIEIDGLTNGVAYSFYMYATNFDGNSLPSNTFGPMTPGPNAKIDPSIQVGDAQARIVSNLHGG